MTKEKDIQTNRAVKYMHNRSVYGAPLSRQFMGFCDFSGGGDLAPPPVALPSGGSSPIGPHVVSTYVPK